MIDEKIIKENYLRMSATELLQLAKTEGNFLTSVAQSLLYQEFKARALDTSLFIMDSDGKIASIQQKNDNSNNAGNAEFLKIIWIYILKEKENGTSNIDIYNGLLQKGFNEEQSSGLLLNMETKVIELLAAHNKNVLRGIIIILIGLGICIWTYSDTSTGTIYMLAGGAIVFGIFLAFMGVSSKSRYKTILVNIETERILLEETFKENEVTRQDISVQFEHTQPIITLPEND